LAAAEFLRTFGAVDIEFGRRVGGILVDVFATIPPVETVAVACGPMSGERLAAIAGEVNIFYWAPVMPMMLQLVSRRMDDYYSGTGFLRCKRCKWEWEPQVGEPAICPHCKSSDWKEEEVTDVDNQTTPVSKD